MSLITQSSLACVTPLPTPNSMPLLLLPKSTTAKTICERSEAGLNDRADLTGAAARFPVRRVVAELEVDAIEERALMCVWNDEQLAQLDRVEQQLAAGCRS